MFEAPLISPWIDMILLALLFGILNKLIQHWTTNPKEYFELKKRSQDINKEVRKLSKEQKFEEIKVLQKEAMSIANKQMKMSLMNIKYMLLMLLIAFPILWVISEFYIEIKYNFLLFTVNGLWAYIILGIIISLIISPIYDKMLMKKYIPQTTETK